MIVVDTSALVAIGQREAGFETYLAVLSDTTTASLSQVNFLEVGIVLINRGVLADPKELRDWLTALDISLDDHGDLGGPALEAYLRYGKGVHPARLNLADCFAYALARKLDAPLLYKGDDFAQTDIRSAL